MSQKPRVTTSREMVYGWYPPQSNIYLKPSYKQLHGYDKECLYKQANESYSAVNHCATVPDPHGIVYRSPSTPRQTSSARKQRSASVRRASVVMPRARSATNGAVVKLKLTHRENENQRQVDQETMCVNAVPPARLTPPNVERHQVSTATQLREAWVFNKLDPQFVLYPVGKPDPIPKPDLTSFRFSFRGHETKRTSSPQENTTAVREEKPRHKTTVPTTRTFVTKRRSVQSAAVRRPKFPHVPDMEKLKREVRPKTAPSLTSVHPECIPPVPSDAESPVPSDDSPHLAPDGVTPLSRDDVSPEPDEHSEDGSASPIASTQLTRVKSAPATCRSSVQRPETPTPGREVAASRSATEQTPATPEPDKPDSELTYDELVNKYGWRAQIKGDPFKLKKNVIGPRILYKVHCTYPAPRKDPPIVHSEAWDTFFLNTIPRRAATYTISPDWISEVLHAKRMQLQKREGGVNYRYKDFSFVY